ncbi:hypothetical protein [Neorhizobium sp. T25_13]|uniref:hypothetical protein n=1 Tax=Neorhizobium sp. T25_13 TaxID=2093830 RepID=UPI00155F42F2|nr:hypothetical protein [Neorhizobium sp. T25_13]
MDEISLNIVRLHCRSPLSSGENARLKKALYRRFSVSPRKGNVACLAKEKAQRQMLGCKGTNGQAPSHCRMGLSKRPFAGRIIPVSAVWEW